MDQAVGLGQEQVQVLNTEKETAFKMKVSYIFPCFALLRRDFFQAFLMQVSGKNLKQEKSNSPTGNGEETQCVLFYKSFTDAH